MKFDRKDLDKLLSLFGKLKKSKTLSHTGQFFVETVLSVNGVLFKEFESLREENGVLKQRIEKLEYAKNSENSSLAPSLDPNRKRGRKEPTKKQSDKKRSTGGQKGHPGNTLRQVKDPSEIILYPLKGRCDCGQSLSKLDQVSE